MVATGFSPILKHSSVGSEVYQREWGPPRHLQGNIQRSDPQRALDTVRALVEQGHTDPIEASQSTVRYETAIMMYDHPWDEVFKYLLQQIRVDQIHELASRSLLTKPDVFVPVCPILRPNGRKDPIDRLMLLKVPNGPTDNLSVCWHSTHADAQVEGLGLRAGLINPIIIRTDIWMQWFIRSHETIVSRLVELACLSKDPTHLQTTLRGLIEVLRIYSRPTLTGQLELEQSTSGMTAVRKRFKNILQPLLDAGVDLHDYSSGCTPLGGLIDRASPCKIFEKPDHYIDRTIQVWLNSLEECGVNIRCYLEKEYNLYWYSNAYSFYPTKYFWEEKNDAYYKDFHMVSERFLLFDFTEADPKKSLTVIVKTVYDSRDQNEEREGTDEGMPGSWIE